MFFKKCIWTSARFIMKNWGISALKLFSLTTGMVSLLLIRLFYADNSATGNSLPTVLTDDNYESIALLLVILVIMVGVYWLLIRQQIAARTREFFIRKLYGAGPLEIAGVLMLEAFLFLLAAFLLSLSLIDQLSPLFNRFTGHQVNFSANESDISIVTWSFLLIVPAFLIMLLPSLRCAGWRAVEFLKKLGR